MDTTTDEPGPANARPAASEAQAKALASSLRLRMLRVCLHEARTNREIAEVLGLHPATCLHHVRRLVDTGFLAGQPARRGRRGAREVPYLATRLSWALDVPCSGSTMVDSFLADIDGLAETELDVSRLGVKLPAAQVAEFRDRLYALLQDLAAQPSDPRGQAWSVFVAVHPDQLTRDPAPEQAGD